VKLQSGELSNRSVLGTNVHKKPLGGIKGWAQVIDFWVTPSPIISSYHEAANTRSLGSLPLKTTNLPDEHDLERSGSEVELSRYGNRLALA